LTIWSGWEKSNSLENDNIVEKVAVGPAFTIREMDADVAVCEINKSNPPTVFKNGDTYVKSVNPVVLDDVTLPTP
jgi:hypothetical protein